MSATPAAAATATYSSPTGTPATHALSASLSPLPTNPSTSDRVAYLAALQAAVKALQGDVNTFLTQRMEDDKAQSGAVANVDDAKEEENYGEELVEDD